MIYGQIAVPETKAAYSKAVLEALEWLRTADHASLAPGKHLIDGDRMFVLVNEYTTAPKEQKRPEVHEKYLDVQYMAAGQEYIGCYPNDKKGSYTEDRMAAGDVAFYAERDDVEEIMLPMTEGCYAVLFPEDVHRPGCVWGSPMPVRKLVVKVRIDSL